VCLNPGLGEVFLSVGFSLFLLNAEVRAMYGKKTIPTRNDSYLGDGGHLGDDRQVVDDERDRLLLVLGQVLSVTKDAEAGDVSGGVSVVLVHQTGADPIESEMCRLLGKKGIL